MTLSITLENCGFSIGGKRVLAPLDLHIQSGETMVLLGPSGCGKTTLLRLIAGLEKPDPGSRILFGSRDVTALPIERRNVGMVFQNYALFKHMDVAQNVSYGLKIRKLPRAEIHARTCEMLAMMQLEALADRPVGALSGGQRQRVALARAIAPRPDVLLLDEPLSALDATLRDALRAEIDSTLRHFGTTALYVSHDQPEAMQLADRIAVLKAGHIEQVDTAVGLWQQPATPFVATFFGGGTLLAATLMDNVLSIDSTAVPWPQAERSAGAVSLLLRPDSATIVPATTPQSLPVTIESGRFLGDRFRLVLRCAESVFPLDAPPDFVLPQGPVGLLINPARSVVLPRAIS